MIFKLVTIIILLSVKACAPASKVSSLAISLQKEMTPFVSIVVLAPSDVIDVNCMLLPELNYQQNIRRDGNISLQIVDKVTAVGLTPEGLSKHLTLKTRRELFPLIL